MKNRKPMLSLLAAACILGIGSSAYAATCNNTQGSISAPPATPVSLSGNSCTHNLNYSGSSALCGGTSFSTTGTDVYQLTIPNSGGFSATVTSPGTGGTTNFVPDIAIVSVSCADNATCVNNGGLDQEGPSANPSSATATLADNTGQTGGSTFFLIITDSTAAGNQCGNYDLSFAGTLPVKLQDFSVR
jgi:hypothetical protein